MNKIVCILHQRVRAQNTTSSCWRGGPFKKILYSDSEKRQRSGLDIYGLIHFHSSSKAFPKSQFCEFNALFSVWNFNIIIHRIDRRSLKFPYKLCATWIRTHGESGAGCWALLFNHLHRCICKTCWASSLDSTHWTDLQRPCESAYHLSSVRIDVSLFSFPFIDAFNVRLTIEWLPPIKRW